jgi:hypothetical protein
MQMGYKLDAFIGKHLDLQPIARKYPKAKIIRLEHGIGLIPMTEELYDEINDFVKGEDIMTLTYLNSNIESRVIELVGKSMIAYAEAEYFGGIGGESALLWKDGIRLNLIPFGKGAINSILKTMGISAEEGLDEFDTVGLGKHRDTVDWLEA